ncbi:hypothetical protein VM1G_11073 [Cytospora mali]|uniref:Rhodopsin domain-containing protein n=1 Tax=Cytospora mali TaxID=578113 RepID=A0A194VK70_CYTMA|nr:hypothetical protein VM1G_11073 [Valsa mali]
MASSGTATSSQLSQSDFLGINWFLFALCFVAFVSRIYIRWVCFRRLLAEDFLMLAAMLLLTGIEALSQYYAGFIYHLMAYVNGTATIGPDFVTNTEGMLKSCGPAIIMFLIGFYFIKVNFLLFFYRLGNRAARIFRIVWWVVFGIVLVCGIASVTMGVSTFKCLFGGIFYTFTTCETVEYENKFFTYFRASVALDIFTDALIIGFLVWILWGVRISLRKKIALGAIFSLVGFTVVATILRGALLSEVFEQTEEGGKTFNIPWVWFWFHVELCIAFIVACLVSFRSLFVHREQQPSAALRAAAMQRRRSHYHPYPAAVGDSGTLQGSGNGSRKTLVGFRARISLFQDSVLDTCRTLEGVFDDEVTLVDMPELSGRSDLGAVAGQDGGTIEEHAHDNGSTHVHDDLEHQGEAITNIDTVSVSPMGQDRRSVSTSLSLDSLYIQETQSRSQRGSVSPEQPSSSRDEQLTGPEPSPLTPNPLYQDWR